MAGCLSLPAATAGWGLTWVLEAASLEGFGASSSGWEPAVLVRDVDGGSSVGVDKIPVKSNEVLTSGGTMSWLCSRRMRAFLTTLLYAILCRTLYLASHFGRPQIVKMVCKDLLIVPALPMINACTQIACQPVGFL